MDELPQPGDIMFANDLTSGEAAISWCYTEPRVLTRLYTNPIPIHVGQNIQYKDCNIEVSHFLISANKSSLAGVYLFIRKWIVLVVPLLLALVIRDNLPFFARYNLRLFVFLHTCTLRFLVHCNFTMRWHSVLRNTQTFLSLS